MHFTTLPASPVDRRSAGFIPVSELPSRAAAATRMAMGSDAYSDENRADVAAEIVAAVLAELPGDATRRAPMDRVQVKHGRPADVLRWIDRAELDAPKVGTGDFIAASAAATIRLYNRACTLRRSVDRQRERDAQDAAERAASAFSAAPITGPDAETVGTPLGARRAAMALLDDIGLRPLRKGDAPIFTLAYASFRATAGLESREIAAELGITFGTLRNHLSAAAGKIPAAPHKDRTGETYGRPRAAWVDALALPEGGTERPRVAPMPESNGVRTGMGKDGETAAFPNVAADRQRIRAGEVAASVGAADRQRWDTLPAHERETAAWAKSLPARSASRLAAAAVITRKRADAKSDVQREADRASI